MKKNIKLIWFVLMFSITFSFSVTAKAEEKEYSILNADFYAQLQKNGNVMVTEKWEVEYEKGAFTRFYKDINKDVPKIEEFTDVEVLSCKINGVEAEETYSEDRIDYHYYFENKSDVYRIQWFYGAEDEIVTYEITYLVTDVVKENAEGKAIFSYRFVGEDFEKNILNTSITYELPEKGEVKASYRDVWEEQIDEQIFVLPNSNVSGILKYRIETTPEMFDTLTYVSISTSEEEDGMSEGISSV